MNKDIGFSCLILTFLFFIMSSCSNRIDYKKYRIDDLSKKLNDTLKVQSSERINNIEILIKGDIKGKATIEFENGSDRYNKLELEGVVDQVYDTEWYDKNFHFIYTPVSVINGDSLILQYRIY